MQISNNFIAVTKPPEKQQEGFTEVKVIDDFIYKGVVTLLPDIPVYIGNRQLSKDDVVIFAKYQPDSYDIEHEGTSYKFINTKNILGVL